MNLGAKFQEAAGTYGARTQHITNTQTCIARGIGDHLWEAVIDLVEIAT